MKLLHFLVALIIFLARLITFTPIGIAIFWIPLYGMIIAIAEKDYSEIKECAMMATAFLWCPVYYWIYYFKNKEIWMM